MASWRKNKRPSLRCPLLSLATVALAFLPGPAFARPATLTKNVSFEAHSDFNPGGRQVYQAGTIVDAIPAANGQFLAVVGEGPKFLVPASSLRFDPEAPRQPIAVSSPTVATPQASTASKPIEGADLKTLSGKVYKNARFARAEPDGITYFFEGGVIKVPFADLSEETRKKYGYDPKKAADFESAEIAAQEAAVQREAREKEAEETARTVEYNKTHTHSVLEVESDMPSFLDRTLCVNGAAEISSLYLAGYSDAQNGYYTFRVRDKSGSCLCYPEKRDGEALRRQLLQDGVVRARIWLRIDSSKIVKGQMILTPKFLFAEPPPSE